MLIHPFRTFNPYRDHLSVFWLQKEDRIRTDDDVPRRTSTSMLVSLRQMHGATTVVMREPTRRRIEADGMITDIPGLLLAIRVADCQSFCIYAPKQHILGMMHVGWRSLKAGMIASFFRTLEERFSVGGEDVIVGAGPSLCTRCAEFTDPARELAGTEHLIIDGLCADLHGIAEAQLLGSGVRPDAFERMSGCTRCDPQTFWTYRGGDREKVMEGWTNLLCAELL